MEKVLVIGCPGAGKSTLSRRLHELTGLPLYHLDLIWHLPDRTHVTREEFDSRLAGILAREQWIIDGNYGRTLGMRLEKCDTVLLLDYPLDVCLSGAVARVGKKHGDLPWVEECFDEEFRQWIEDFPRDQLPQIYELLSHVGRETEILIFHSRAEADEWIKTLEERI
jgi:adenylate kinase family enzyme